MSTNRPMIRFKRGPWADAIKYIGRDGEPMWITDKKELRIGDGVTPGGILAAAYDAEPKAFLIYWNGYEGKDEAQGNSVSRGKRNKIVSAYHFCVKAVNAYLR
jgi:hypothetical protein